MSKGLGKLQRTIVGLLDGTIPHEVYRPGSLTTSELLDELERRGLVRQGTPRKIAMHAVRRTCIALSDRGILDGEYIVHDPCHWAKVLCWNIVARPNRAERETRVADRDASA
jgi:hypothetical protein